MQSVDRSSGVLLLPAAVDAAAQGGAAWRGDLPTGILKGNWTFPRVVPPKGIRLAHHFLLHDGTKQKCFPPRAMLAIGWNSPVFCCHGITDPERPMAEG